MHEHKLELEFECAKASYSTLIIVFADICSKEGIGFIIAWFKCRLVASSNKILSSIYFLHWA